jgi:hypothetical protein
MSQYHESDEYTHQPSDEVDFNESMYLNYFDENNAIGGFLRVGNRPNEGYAEVTNVTYLPDGSVLFAYQRPATEGNQTLEAAGMSFRVIRPFAELKLSYEGTAFHFQDPKVLKNPKEAFATSPRVDCKIVLDATGIGQIRDHLARAGKRLDDVRFWKEHYEQVVRVRGLVHFGDTTYQTEGLGLRDHSWGPRTWQSPEYYRWLSGVFDEGNAFGLMYLATSGGRLSKKGFITVDGDDLDLEDIQINTEYVGPDKYHDTVNLELKTSDRVFGIKGKVLTVLPLRNRKDGKTVRIAEGMTRWDWDGKLGYGLAEYHDHMEG